MSKLLRKRGDKTFYCVQGKDRFRQVCEAMEPYGHDHVKKPWMPSRDKTTFPNLQAQLVWFLAAPWYLLCIQTLTHDVMLAFCDAEKHQVTMKLIVWCDGPLISNVFEGRAAQQKCQK